jgi:outer membrane protein
MATKMKNKSIFFSIFFLILISSSPIFAQKIAFIASDVIRDKFPEAKSAEQRLKSIVDDWKRELEAMDKQIEELKLEISKNRLIWSDDEKNSKNKELEDLIMQKQVYARSKFEQNGEYDQSVKMLMQPIEDKIYAAVQSVAADDGFDFVFDRSAQPIPYSNSKYDLTVKVLRKLGVDVKAMEKELQEKIEKDPRNQKKDTKAPPGKRTRPRTRTDIDSREIEREPEQNPGNNENTPNPDVEPNPDIRK